MPRNKDNSIEQLRSSRLVYYAARLWKKYISRQRQLHVAVEIVSGFASSFTEREILDSGDQRKIRLIDTTKYRQLYTV